MMPPKWTAERLCLLQGMVAEGLSQGQIAREMGVTISSVSGMIRRNGFISPNAKAIKPKAATSKRRPTRDRISNHPDARDCSSPHIGNDDEHVALCLALGGFPVLNVQAVR